MRRLDVLVGGVALVALSATAASAASAPYGAIGAEWAQLGGSSSFLGQPLTDEADGWYGGRFVAFQGGSIYWSWATGAHEVHGGIRQAWANTGWEFGPLRYPTTDEQHTARGAMQRFQGGQVYWSAGTGAHGVYGAILGKWAQAGGVGVLGYPATDEYGIAGGRRQNFEHGTVDWTPTGGAVANYRFGTTFVVGDSITTGFWATTTAQAFPALTAARYGSRLVKVDQPGATLVTVSAMTTVPAGVDLAVVELGTNDVLAGTAPATFASQYRTLLARIRAAAPYAPLVCIGSWRDPRLALQGPLDGVIHDECVRVGGHPFGVVDLYNDPADHAVAGRTTFNGVSRDSFHPGDLGHRAFSDRVAAVLR